LAFVEEQHRAWRPKVRLCPAQIDFPDCVARAARATAAPQRVEQIELGLLPEVRKQYIMIALLDRNPAAIHDDEAPAAHRTHPGRRQSRPQRAGDWRD